MEYLEIQDKIRAIVLSAPKHHLVTKLTLAIVDMLAHSKARAADLEQQIASVYYRAPSERDAVVIKLRAQIIISEELQQAQLQHIDKQAGRIAELEAQLAAIRATDNGTMAEEEELCLVN